MHLRRYFAQALFVNDVLSLSEEELYALPETNVLLKIRDNKKTCRLNLQELC
ncbi:hypothetical protein SAMN05216390_12422 [Lachnospiraceae bacterium KH1T2]|nr:hypothetical protein SAMN05216390_12422 [Lachnospiraceae bacterium KH1T2]